MKDFIVYETVESVRIYHVSADNEQEARDLVENGTIDHRREEFNSFEVSEILEREQQ